MGYRNRVKNIRKKYGKDAFRDWGKKGGNPVLLSMREAKKRMKPLDD